MENGDINFDCKTLNQVIKMEIFKKSYGNYEVSNFGNIRRATKGGYKELKGNNTVNGYKTYHVYPEGMKGKKKTRYVHQDVLQLFEGDRPDGLIVDHIDRNRSNNHIDNLRYATYSENAINSSRFRTDIEEVDPKARHAIIKKQFSQNKREQEKES